MKRLLPYPVLAGFIFFMWMVLAQAYSPGQMVLGALVAIAATWAMTALKLDSPRLRRPRAALRLAGVVTLDIIRSNIAVAHIITRREPWRNSDFLAIPLDMRSPNGLAVLSCIVTATPGTIWVHYDRADDVLLLHILDLVSEEAWTRLIKGRYERYLMEIFE